MVTLPMLVDELQDSLLQTPPSELPTVEFDGIYMVDGETVCEPGQLYLGSEERLSQLLIRNGVGPDTVLVSAGGGPALQNAPRREALLLQTDLELSTLYNRINHLFTQYRAWQQALQAGAHRGLNGLLRAATSLCDGSFLLLNTDLRGIADSLREEDTPFFWPNLDDPDDKPSAILRELRAALGTGEICLSQRREGYIYALTPLLSGAQVQGYLFGCGQGKRSTLRNMTYAVAQQAGQLLREQPGGEEQNIRFQDLAAQLFDPRPADLEKLEFQLRRLPHVPRRYMRGVIIRILDDDGAEAYPDLQKLSQMLEELKKLFPRENMAQLDDALYLLLSSDEWNVPTQLDSDPTFAALLKRYGAFAIIANPSARLRGVRVLYRQCVQVLPAAVAVRYQTEQRCLFFERYSPYYIVRMCEQSAKALYGEDDILYLCHPGVLTLTRYDRAYNGNLRDTLFTFLMNDRSISATSRQMFLHRNTTIYKLNKIEELIGASLDDPYLRHQLVLSCMIIRYVEEYRHNTVNLPVRETGRLRK